MSEARRPSLPQKPGSKFQLPQPVLPPQPAPATLPERPAEDVSTTQITEKTGEGTPTTPSQSPFEARKSMQVQPSASGGGKVFNAKKTIEHLQSNDKALCLATLSQLSQMKNVNVIPREVVDALNGLLRATDTNRLIIITTLGVLAHFANFDRTKMMLGDCGVIQVIVPYLNSYTEIVKHKAVEVILGLCTNQKNQVKLVESLVRKAEDEDTAIEQNQVMLALIALLQREEGEVQEKAMAVLKALFKNRQCVEIILTDDQVLEALTMMLEVHDKTKRRFAVETFETLTHHHPELCRNLFELNCVEYLLEALTTTDDIDITVPTLKILNNIAAQRDTYRLWIGEHNGIDVLVELLLKTAKAPKERKTYSEMMAEQQAKIEALKKKPAQEGAEAPAEDTPAETPESEKSVTPATPQGEPKKPEEHDMNAIVEATEQSQLILIYYCVKLLAAVTEEISGRDTGLLRDNKELFLAKDGLKLMLQLLGNDKLDDSEASEGVREICMKVISNVSGQDSSAKSVDKAVLDTLVEMLVETVEGKGNVSEFKLQQKKKHAVKTMASFAKMEESVIKLIEMGVISKLLALMKEKHPASATIAEIFAELNSHSNFQKLLYEKYKEESGMQTFLTLVKEGKEELHEPVAALRALAPFADNANGRLVLHDEGVFSTLKSMVDVFQKERDEYETAAKKRAEKRNERKVARQRRQAQMQLLAKQQAQARIMSRAGAFNKGGATQSATPSMPVRKGAELEEIDVITEEMDEAEERNDNEEKRRRSFVPEVIELARSLLRKAKKEHDASKKLNLQSSTPFSLDYNAISIIDRELLQYCQQRILDAFPGNKIKLQINWKFLDKLVDAKTWEEEQQKLKQQQMQETAVELAKKGSKGKLSKATSAEQIKKKHSSLSSADLMSMVEEDKELNPETKEEALHLLARESLWTELAIALEAYANCFDKNAVHAFVTQVRQVVVEVRSKPCIEVEDLVMRYAVGFNEVWSPKTITAKISELILGYDVTMFEEEEEIDEQYEIAVNSLKKVCRDSRIAMIGDINILFFHLEMFGDELFQPSTLNDQKRIIASKGIIQNKSAELFLKGWPIVKLNKHGVPQERILVLTNCAYYTVSVDMKNKKIDTDHCKMHPLKEFVVVDVGQLVTKAELKKQNEKLRMAYMEHLIKQADEQQAQQGQQQPVEPPSPRGGKEDVLGSIRGFNRKTLKSVKLETPPSTSPSRSSGASSGSGREFEEGFEKWKKEYENTVYDTEAHEKVWALNIVTNEKAHKGILSELKKEESEGKRKSKEQNKRLSELGLQPSSPVNEEDTENDLVTENLKEEAAIMAGEAREVIEKKRPNTEGMYNSVFVAPDYIPKNKHKLLLEEIAWTFYAASCAYHRDPLKEPFEVPILKPYKDGFVQSLFHLVGASGRRNSTRV